MSQGLFLAGDVMLALYTSGVVGPYSDPINATELVLNQPAADVKTRTSRGKAAYGTTLGSVSLPKAEELSLKFDEAGASLFALALRGTASSFTQTSATAQGFSITAKLGYWVKLPFYPITPGSVVITGKTENTDFAINYDAGMIKALVGGSIADGATVNGTAGRDATSGSVIAGGIISSVTAALLLDGVNKDTGKRCRMEIDKVELAAEGDRNMIAEDYLSTSLKGTIILLSGASEPYRYREFT